VSVWWRPLGCVLWLDFAEPDGARAYDLSGYGNHGTIYGASRRRGPLLRAMSFDGVDDYVDLDVLADDFATFTTFSVEAFIKPTELEVQHIALVRNRDHYIGFIAPRAIRIGARDADTWTFRVLDITTAIPVLEKWWHVCFAHSHEEKILYAYVDGELRGKISDVAVVTSRGHHNSIGANYNRTSFAGCLCATLRIYARALTEGEVWAHYCYLKSAVLEAP